VPILGWREVSIRISITPKAQNAQTRTAAFTELAKAHEIVEK